MAHSEESLPSRGVVGAEASIGIASPAAGAEAEPVAAPASGTRVSSPFRDAWRRYRKNWAAMVSLGIVLFIVVVAAFAPFMRTQDPYAQNYSIIWAGPSPAHWMGANADGSDQYSILMYGMRIPLVVGLLGTILTVGVGSLLGLMSGYFGGAIDSLISRITDLFFAFPAFLLALLSMTLFGQSLDNISPTWGRVIVLTIVFSLVSWPPLTRFVRSLALSMREQQYIEAARTCGSGSWKIIRRHLLPNMFGLILVQGALITVGIIYTEVALSIFGVGVQQPNPDPGQMLYAGVQALQANVAPGIYAAVVFPSAVLGILLLALTFIGDGVRDAVDPRMNS